MQTRRRAFGSGVLVFAAFLMTTSMTPLWAAGSSFAKVEVSTPAAPRGLRISREFSETVHREVRALRLPPARSQAYVLSAALTRFETHQDGDRVATTCGVSIAVRDERRGDLRVILNGRATAEDAKSRQHEGRRVALEAAVRSALRRLPSSLE